jgi:Family of unknown function (DUF5670)
MHPLAWLGILLLALWVIAWLVFEVASLAVHLLLVAAVVLVLWGLVRGGARGAEL